MRRMLRATCRRVGRKTFVRGMDNGMKIAVLLLVVLIVCCVASCGKDPGKGEVYRIYEVVETRVITERSESNPEAAKPVFSNSTQFIVMRGNE